MSDEAFGYTATLAEVVTKLAHAQAVAQAALEAAQTVERLHTKATLLGRQATASGDEDDALRARSAKADLRDAAVYARSTIADPNGLVGLVEDRAAQRDMRREWESWNRREFGAHIFDDTLERGEAALDRAHKGLARVNAAMQGISTFCATRGEIAVDLKKAMGTLHSVATDLQGERRGLVAAGWARQATALNGAIDAGVSALTAEIGAEARKPGGSDYIGVPTGIARACAAAGPAAVKRREPEAPRVGQPKQAFLAAIDLDDVDMGALVPTQPAAGIGRSPVRSLDF